MPSNSIATCLSDGSFLKMLFLKGKEKVTKKKVRKVRASRQKYEDVFVLVPTQPTSGSMDRNEDGTLGLGLT